MSESKKIFLIGFMGSGKTTLGKKLAQHLNEDFFDLDTEVEKLEGKTVDKIFELEGQVYFRELERKVLKQFVDDDKSFVMALGGGTPCFYNNMELIKQAGISIYLKYNVGMLTSRLMNTKTVRPLLINMLQEEMEKYIEDTLGQREYFYNQCQYTAEGKNIKVTDVLALLQDT